MYCSWCISIEMCIAQRRLTIPLGIPQSIICMLGDRALRGPGSIGQVGWSDIFDLLPIVGEIG